MGRKSKPQAPEESHLITLSHPGSGDLVTPIVDTHTHLISTFQRYLQSYPNTKFNDIFSFVRGLYGKTAWGVETKAIIDVWCEAPVTKMWKEIADSAVKVEDRAEKWGGVEYWFVMGVHPHHAESYNDAIEQEIVEAMKHPRCVGWGEIGLDYRNSPARPHVQHEVFARQLRQAVRLGKAITVHTREAEEDTERILKAEVPRDHPIHVHCYTDSPELALRLLEHFPNLYFGITGVITYSTNLNTSALVKHLASPTSAFPMRILLETDAPYMVPSNVYRDLDGLKQGSKLPISHTGMIPWTADWVAKVAEQVRGPDCGDLWTVERVMKAGRENAMKVYGV
ncbi:hypothetical protein M422DRAFT_253649 [Sphaerobolus stellatus SS14]|uniref:Metallo-dependent hydrolase n=1 Tax=Sphaerobolus stellatus (strain SS14) TaxID=990650 RepID=A0A0C9VXI4_SPHS4|nr:hypothetical protein M422DRAFT_253649 [Sphaerobolus stellatus SS14]